MRPIPAAPAMDYPDSEYGVRPARIGGRGACRRDRFPLTGGMNIAEARTLITRGAERMAALGGEQIFDEWAIVALAADGARLAAYCGPRVERFRARFKADIRPLQAELEGRRLEVGEFAFVADAVGTAYDACVRIGPHVYLWWNHTRDSLAEIRNRGSWLPAQKAFVDLCEAFRHDPVDVT